MTLIRSIISRHVTLAVTRNRVYSRIASIVLMAVMGLSCTPTPTPNISEPFFTGDLSKYSDSAWSCLQNQDTSHFLFHGCIDWHSSVHAHWAVLRYGNHDTVTAAVDSVIVRLQSNALQQERDYMADRPNFEMPYGRAWFLALAIEYERRVSDGAVSGMANDMATSLRDFLSTNTIDPAIREYGNHTWALTQLLRFYRHRGDTEGEAWVHTQVDNNYLNYDPAINPAIDLDRPDFFSVWGNWAHLLGLRDREKLKTWLDQQVISSEDLAVVANPNSAHQLGMNPSRAWGLSWVVQVSDEPKFADALTAHIAAIEQTHEEEKNDYFAYGHWVPQFAMYALTQPGVR